MLGVKLKGTKQGIIFLIDLKTPLMELKEGMSKLLVETSEYFKRKAVSLSFEETGQLEDEFKIKEIQKLVLESGFMIDCNVKMVENTVVKEVNKTKILKTSLRAGNIFKFDGNIILFGDLHAGAKVVVTGSFICLGELKGIVYAGQKKDDEEQYNSDEVCVYASKIDSPKVKVKNEMVQNIKEKNWLHVVE